MNKLLFIALLATMSIGFVSCGGSDRQGDPGMGQGPQPFPVIKIPKQDVTAYTVFPASIEGAVSSDVRAKVPGYITKVLVDEGDRVRKNQVLFRLETQSLSQEADAAKARINVAQVEVNKLKPLVEKNIISEVQLETAKANLEQAKSNYNSIMANIGYANIKSPVNGVVGSINYREGALVSPQDPRPMTNVSAIKNVYAYFSMNEKEFLQFYQNTEGKDIDDKIKKLPPVKLILANGQEYDKAGKIETISGDIDAQTGTVTFRAKFSNESGLLRNGSSGKVKVPNVLNDVVVVPISSTFEQQGKVIVYKVQGDSLAVSQAITTKENTDNLYVVASGIEENDVIVAEGVGKLRNNTPIKPNLIAFDSIANALTPVFK